MKKQYVVGNWKMNQHKADIFQFLDQLKGKVPFQCESWIAPQALHLYLMKDYSQMTGLKLGAQNCSTELSGAFTGELSLSAIKDLGGEFVIIGHSERRQIFNEDNRTINKKLKLALKEKLISILCVGETETEREQGATEQVLEKQITEGLAQITDFGPNQLIIAYEPVWAIGTGKTATPEMAEEAHLFISELLMKKFQDRAQTIPLLYGGSVKSHNFKDLLDMPHIDGGLVGGASLKAEDFIGLCQIASEKG